MIYAVIMAVAFVAAVTLATILIVTRRKEKALMEEEELAPVAPVKPGQQASPSKKEQREDLSSYIPNTAQEDFGFSPANPISSSSVPACESYLSRLRFSTGENVLWLRDGVEFVQDLQGLGSASVNAYKVYLRGKAYKRLYFYTGGKSTSRTPRGFALSPEGQKSPFGGNIALEAEQKGITVEQVLQKQALIYQNRSRQAAARQDAAKNGTGRQAMTKDATDIRNSPRPSASAPVQKPIQPKEDVAPVQKPVEEEPSASSFPNYLPGFEPEKIKPNLDKFLAVMDAAYPDGTVLSSTWDHEHWDRAAAILCKYLGYSNGTDFLEAYGYTVVK